MKCIDRVFINKLEKALSIESPDLIPRSGERGEKVDCYSVYVTDSEGSYLADKVVENNKLKVRVWDEQERTHKRSKLLDLNKLGSLNFTIHHYHGLVTHTYDSVFDFLLHELSGLYKLQSKYAIAKYAVPKFLHSRRKHKTPDRSKVLKAIVKLSENNHTQTLNVTTILNRIYGMYAILHPQYPTLKQSTMLVLKSLAESEEIELINSYECRIKGKALTTLENLKLDATERKRTSVTMWLTVVLAVTALFQAKLVITDLELNLDTIVGEGWNWITQLLSDILTTMKNGVMSIFEAMMFWK